MHLATVSPRLSLVPEARALDALACRAQAREPGAEQQLCRALERRLRPLVRHRLAARAQNNSRVELDDFMQELLLVVWRVDLPRFDASRSGFLTFVTKRLGWQLADSARRARRCRTEAVEARTLERVGDESKSPATLLAAQAHEHQLQALPRQLSLIVTDADACHAVKRHDLEGASLTEVARELRVHVSNACRARQRGIKRLARHMGARAA